MDREKVIKGLECCNYYGFHEDCPYDKKDPNEEQDTTCMMDLMRDALALLKEQETELSYREAKPITHTATKLDDATCPSCGNVVGEKQTWGERKVFIQWKYCIYCGQKLDWEGR